MSWVAWTKQCENYQYTDVKCVQNSTLITNNSSRSAFPFLIANLVLPSKCDVAISWLETQLITECSILSNWV